ncbi:excision repair ERCC-1-like isoform X1 [Octopus vulgaris]|uniref:DNA excision repair protein ERCC-1 n=2 Tax=Octopus vulgaris TaxID=6645 RepID=A0AA36BCM7_OCTVU|nr:excision repair ERCC-1-like isoform X1 [Octopus vulgaris]
MMAGARRLFQIPSLEEMETHKEKPLPVSSGFHKTATSISSFKATTNSSPAKVTFLPPKSSTPEKTDVSTNKEHIPPEFHQASTSNDQTNTSSKPNCDDSTSKSTSEISSAISENKKTDDPLNKKTSDPLKSANSAQPTVTSKAYSNSIIVNSRQRGNPILKGIRNVPWEFGNIVPDYEMGKACCALFLSLRYHQLHPEYIHKRLESLGKSYDLRIMLVQVDVKDCSYLLKDLGKMCILANCTLILAFSAEEAGRYLETYKVYENKPPDAIMEKSDKDYMSMLTECLTSVKQINKTDCANIISKFMSLEAVIQSNEKDFTFCPGLGPRKAEQLYNVFHEPFLKRRKLPSNNEEVVETSPKK